MKERLFKAKLVEANITTRDLADALGISYATYLRRMRNPGELTVLELDTIAKKLSLSDQEFINIFFK